MCCDPASEVDALARSVAAVADEFVGAVIVYFRVSASFEGVLSALNGADVYGSVAVRVFALFLSVVYDAYRLFFLAAGRFVFADYFGRFVVLLGFLLLFLFSFLAFFDLIVVKDLVIYASPA